MAKLKIVRTRSTIGCTKKQKANMEALGLRKIRSEKIIEDNPVTRGMIKVVNHLVEVTEVVD